MRSILLILVLAHWVGPTPVGSPPREWWENLHSDKGLCCSFADGRTIQGVDWQKADNIYLVRIDGEWRIVPPDAVVKVPNRAGFAVVWPYTDPQGKIRIRCFMPGVES
jgi:hypothetical protein